MAPIRPTRIQVLSTDALRGYPIAASCAKPRLASMRETSTRCIRRWAVSGGASQMARSPRLGGILAPDLSGFGTERAGSERLRRTGFSRAAGTCSRHTSARLLASASMAGQAGSDASGAVIEVAGGGGDTDAAGRQASACLSRGEKRLQLYCSSNQFTARGGERATQDKLMAACGMHGPQCMVGRQVRCLTNDLAISPSRPTCRLLFRGSFNDFRTLALWLDDLLRYRCSPR